MIELLVPARRVPPVERDRASQPDARPHAGPGCARTAALRRRPRGDRHRDRRQRPGGVDRLARARHRARRRDRHPHDRAGDQRRRRRHPGGGRGRGSAVAGPLQRRAAGRPLRALHADRRQRHPRHRRRDHDAAPDRDRRDAQQRRRPRPRSRASICSAATAPSTAAGYRAAPTVWVLVNHFKSQSGGAAAPSAPAKPKGSATSSIAWSPPASATSSCWATSTRARRPRRRAAGQPGRVVRRRRAAGRRLHAARVRSGPRPGTFQSCGLRNRLDYILVSRRSRRLVVGGGIERRGLWGTPTNVNPPTEWDVYPESSTRRPPRRVGPRRDLHRHRPVAARFRKYRELSEPDWGGSTSSSPTAWHGCAPVTVELLEVGGARSAVTLSGWWSPLQGTRRWRWPTRGGCSPFRFGVRPASWPRRQWSATAGFSWAHDRETL